MHLDAHEKPPAALRASYKRFQKIDVNALIHAEEVADFRRGLTADQQTRFKALPCQHGKTIDSVFAKFLHDSSSETTRDFGDEITTASIYESLDIPGLLVFPALVPLDVQLVLLSKVFHRDLSNPYHRTNVDLHYQVKRPESSFSFFDSEPSSTCQFQAKDTSIHKPISVAQFLNKKLRWMTLGGQYDWTRKVYPDEPPPKFPDDIRDLLQGIFPDTDAQAAIVNLYSPGDTLSIHRDVSEECDRGLISLSIGCDCLFFIGIEDEGGTKFLMLRLRSGDIVYMNGASRFAWHGVPQVIPKTCPTALGSWPARKRTEETSNHYQAWEGWMSSKRINLNVRQMWA